MKLYAARIITCDVQNCVQELKIPCTVEEGEGSASRNKQREEQREVFKRESSTLTSFPIH